jgi:hypothetical protein
MAPIPVRQPKGANPLPLQSTLGDLSNLRAQNVDLSILLDHPANQSPGDGIDEAMRQSHDFVESVRRALDIDANVATQGDRVEAVRVILQDIEGGFS